nr:MAG: polyprotein [Wenzhou bat picornavirus 1]
MQDLKDLTNIVKTTLLQNPTTEQKEVSSDRVAATTTANAGNIVQAAVQPGGPLSANYSTEDTYTAMAYDMDTAEKNISKLVIIGDHLEWTNSSGRGERIAYREFPKDLVESNTMPAYGQSRYFRCVRAGLHICVQVNAALGCSGSLIVVYCPHVYTQSDFGSKVEFGSVLNLPHAILNVATTTQAELFIPYTAYENFVAMESKQMGWVGIYVWTKLGIPDGGPTSLTVSILGSLMNPNFQCPRPYGQTNNEMPRRTKKLSHNTKFKWTRERLDVAENMGSMNIANRICTNGAQSIALVGERAFHDPSVAGAKVRVKDLLEVAKIPSCYTNSSTTGAFEWSYSKNNKDALLATDLEMTQFPNMRMMTSAFQFYRGSLKLTVSFFASTFNRGRARVCFFPMHTGAGNIDYNKCRNAINMICDIGLNSSFTMTLPFTSQTWMKPFYEKIGRLQIYVENKMTYTKASVNTFYFVVSLAAGDDFQMYCPTESRYILQGLTSWGSEMDLVDPLEEDNPESIMETAVGTQFKSSDTSFASGPEQASAVGLQSAENKGTLQEIIKEKQPMFLNFDKCRRVAFSVSHSLVDNFFGRAQRFGTRTWDAAALGAETLTFPKADHMSLAYLFAYFAGEINVHIINKSDGFLSMAHTYDLAAEITHYATSSGTILIPPNSAATLCCPFYSRYPLRLVRSSYAGTTPKNLGVLRFLPEATTGTFIYYVSLRNPNFFFPMPVPKYSNRAAMLDDPVALKEIQSEEAAVDFVQQYEEDPYALYERYYREDFNPMVSYIYKRTGYRRQLLKQAGDIETNPGPLSYGDQGNEKPIHPNLLSGPVSTSYVVYKDRGFYKHIGLMHGDSVYHLTSENIVDSALNGTATFTKTSAKGWTKAFPIAVDYFTANYVEGMVGTNYIFSCDSNCETIIRDLFPGTPWITQSQALGLAGGIIICASTLAYCSTQFTINDLKEVFNLSCEGNESAMGQMVQKCMSYFSDLFTQTFASDIIKVIVKAVVRLMCYVVMYCHSPNILTSICLGTLIIMDVTSAGPLSSDSQAILKSLLEGDIRGFCEAIVEKLQYADTEEEIELKRETVKAATQLLQNPLCDESPFDSANSALKGFNAASQAGKNVEWWIATFKRIFTFLKEVFAPSEKKRYLNWLSDHEDLICDLLESVNNHLVNAKKPEVIRDPKFQNQHIWLCRRLNELCAIVVRSALHSPLASTIVRMTTEMHKLKLSQPVSTDTVRMEPVGVWVCGEPGQGKSFFTQTLVKKVSRAMGYHGIFTNPTGSQYMDGYVQQEIHLIDDAGQNRDEQDLALLCQCISSVPFTVPMADINEKGMPYTSKLVVATSNKTDFTSTVLSDPSALKRRFPFYYRIRAKIQYTRDGKLDVPSAMSRMCSGDPWEYTIDGYLWKPVDMDDIVGQVVGELQRRTDGITRWKRLLRDEGAPTPEEYLEAKRVTVGKFQDVYNMVAEETRSIEELCDDFYAELSGIDSPFEALRMKPQYQLEKAKPGVKEWFRKKIKAVVDWAQRNLGWLTLVSIFATGMSLIAAVLIWRNNRKDTEERPYNPQTTNKQVGKIFTGQPHQPYVLSNEAPYNNEIEHVFQNTCYLLGANAPNPIHCLAWKQRKLITYGHVAQELNSIEEPYLVYKGKVFYIDRAKITHVSSKGENMDLIIIEIENLPFQFKDISKYIRKAVSKDSYMIWSSPKGRIMYQVANPYISGFHLSQEGTKNAESITYSIASQKGMCGGVLISKIEGNFYIVGMHIAGNGVVGLSAMLYGFSKPSDEGVIVEQYPAPFPVYQPSKTALHPNLLHGTWPVEQEPAVLSPKDPRLDEPCESIVKKNAVEKYPHNIFNPDKELWEAAVNNVAIRFQKVIGIKKSVDIETAVNGFGKFNRIDLNTSAGLKYSSKGITKRMLIQYDPITINPLLARDVEKLQIDLENDQVKTTFATYLKDELRKMLKIKSGTTRCIEACSLDYVVLHRMVMGEIYEAIYDTPAQVLGCAVGMNPWTDFDALVRSLFPHNYCFDFSKWDGSLSPQFMEAGVYVLANCHENPEHVKRLMKPIITSEQVCLDTVNVVYGGMPSGAPCTTVLNSVCNIIACEYVSLKMAADALAVTYGDDLIYSSTIPVDSRAVCQILYCDLGLLATAADKTSVVKAVHPLEVEFLKRKPAYFHNTGLIVGALDLGSMIQHIMWSHSDEAFDQQLVSFENELVLHGPNVYAEVYKKVESVLSKHGKHMTTFNLAYQRMIPYLFQ